MAAAHCLDFYPILFAGGTGSRLHPITDDLIKALLPVGNKPALFYSLYMLERSAMVVTVPSQLAAISNYVYEQYPSDKLVQNRRTSAPSMTIHIQTVTEGIGTADALREMANSIFSDFVVLSADFIVEWDLIGLLEQHRTRDASLTVVLYEDISSKQTKDAPKDNYSSALEDVALMSPVHHRIFMLESSADVENQISISSHILKYNPRLFLKRNLRDCHLYVFSHWVLELLRRNVAISSIKAELVPFLVRRQYHLSKRCRSWQKLVGKYKWNHEKDSLDIPLVAEYRWEKAIHWTSFPDIVRCYAMILPRKVFARRMHTLEWYRQVNDACLKGWIASCSMGEESKGGEDKASSNKRKNNQRLIVGQELSCGEQSELKDCVIGDHCHMGQRVKLNGCIVMDHVIIGDDCHLQNCIISSNCHILEGCKLKHCTTAASVTIPADTRAKDESFGKLQDSDFLFHP
ncbi:translation initiation factor eIF-2B gamma subunit isoform 2 [Galdieria sulphuraria]|uniref:Translation initiation factor eIF2B subunit gamma n=1 Tax=Galdieria sulphuraria TaxID=130081 RepID=M2XR18_GALSU|nr:translation initiation factor eIF-2B gamma subunit isoform 2 [Galdieria sulphuraria]EME26103.1 translation initiation factor eIF-2B gamma subunit isoform 2 [Galdieria sulphuraria]|eukprot:XP_005702623.1 translation initiation factor eIF-2B gamma subunit isoform 2 [Galdieria sulphuraria]